MIYDIAIIGAGSGGLSVAAAAAQFGQKVVLFERGLMGGDCLNYGCVPSKALIAAAEHAQGFRDCARYGITAADPKVDYGAVHAYVHGVIAAIAPNDSVDRFEKLGVNVVQAAARFRDAATIECSEGVFKARRFVIATGSRASIPPIEGLASVPYLTNETIFNLKALPSHLVIVGGGPIGMELAQAYRRLGAQVTVIEALAPLAKDDHELRSLVIQKLMEEGVRILAPAAIRKVTKSAEGIRVEIEQHDIISGSHILVAAGRLANVEGLGLEAAGVFFTPKGIRVDAALRSSQKHIYAVGDVAGGPQFTHVANYHAGLVIRSILFRLPVKNRADTIPRVTYTDPELASAGLSEAEARQKFGNSVRVMRSPFLENDRAQTEGKPQGLVKAIIGRRGRILGVAIAGQQAGELIQPWVLAMGNGLKVQALAAMVVPYPTLGEASRQASVNYFSGLATSPWVRRAIKLMSFLG